MLFRSEILLTVIIILLIINIVIALTKNNRLQTERLEGLLREEMKENRDELGRNIRELRNELNQTLNYIEGNPVQKEAKPFKESEEHKVEIDDFGF